MSRWDLHPCDSAEAEPAAELLCSLKDRGWSITDMALEIGTSWRRASWLLRRDPERAVSTETLEKVTRLGTELLATGKTSTATVERDRNNLAAWFISRGRLQEGGDLLELISAGEKATR